MINLDFFISYTGKIFNISNLYNLLIVSESLKSKYSKVLMSKNFYSTSIEIRKFYQEEFDKMIVTSFLPTLKFMSNYVGKQLNNFNNKIATISVNELDNLMERIKEQEKKINKQWQVIEQLNKKKSRLEKNKVY